MRQRLATWLLLSVAAALLAAPLEAALRARERLLFEWRLRDVVQAMDALADPEGDRAAEEEALRRAVDALLAAPGDVERLVAGLDDATLPRHRAACALTLRIGPREALPAGGLDARTRQLLALFRPEVERSPRLVARTPELRELLRREVRDRASPEVRRGALELLGELGPPDPWDDAVVVPCLDDPEPQVRQAALRTLLALRQPGAPVRHLASAPPAVRAAATRALSDASPLVRLAALRAQGAVPRAERARVARLVCDLLLVGGPDSPERVDALALLPAVPEAAPPGLVDRFAPLLRVAPGGDWFFAAVDDPRWTASLCLLVTSGALRSPAAWLAWARLDPAGAAAWLEHGSSLDVVDWLDDEERRPALRQLARSPRSPRLEAAAVEWLARGAVSPGPVCSRGHLAVAALLASGDPAAADVLATFAAGARLREDAAVRRLRREAGWAADVLRGELSPRLAVRADDLRHELREWLLEDASFEVPVVGPVESDAERTLAVSCLALADEPDATTLLGPLGGRIPRALTELVRRSDPETPGLVLAAEVVPDEPEARCLCGSRARLADLARSPRRDDARGRARLFALVRSLARDVDDVARSTLHHRAEWLLHLRLLERGLGLRPRLDPLAVASRAAARPPAREAAPIAHVRRADLDAGDPRLEATWGELREELERRLRALGWLVRDGDDRRARADVELRVTLARAVDERGPGASWLDWEASIRAGEEVVDVRPRRPDVVARVYTPIGVGQELARALAIEARDALGRSDAGPSRADPP